MRADIVNDTSNAYRNPYATWGNSGSKVSLFNQYKDWVESVRNSLYADVTLKVDTAPTAKTFNNFNVALGELGGATSKEEGAYNIVISRGKIDESSGRYNDLITQISKDYGCTVAEAKALFNDSDIYQSIVRSLENVNTSENKSQKVTDATDRVREEEYDKPWYDEEVKTFIVRRYCTDAVTTKNIILSDKLDYNLSADSTAQGGNDAQQDYYNGYDARWYLTLYLKDNHTTTSGGTNLYITEQSVFNPNNGLVNEASAYYKNGNVLINNLYIKGADFIVPSAVTNDMVR